MNRSNKKNSLKGMIKIVGFILLLLMTYNFFTSFKVANKKIETYELVVGSNDTIWNIANTICKKDSNLNVQNVMIEIKQINNLSSSNIFVGQTLDVPVY